MKKHHEEIIYRALRGQATPEEEEMIAQWYRESPEECSREIEAIHSIIDLTGMAGIMADRSSAHSHAHKNHAAITTATANTTAGAVSTATAATTNAPYITEAAKTAGKAGSTTKSRSTTAAKAGNKKEKRRHRSVWMAAISSAAAVALAIVTGYISHELTYSSISSQMTAVEAPPGEHFIITLPDSSSVHLNSGAKIEYPVVFRKDKREVYLTGEAMFDVTHDESRPFVVRTFTSEVSVLGTKFDVEAYKESSIFTATLLEGRVRVVNLSDPERKGVILNPNDVIRIENGIMRMEKISGQDDICWTKGLIKIGGKTFDRTMEDFEKAFGVNIEIDMKQLPDISEVSGKIRVNDGVANAMRILQKTADFRFRINETTNTVTIY